MGWSNKDKAHGRDYKREYAVYQGTEEQKKKRAQRNAARAALAKEGRVSKGDGKDVDHKKPIRSGGTNAKGNLRVKPAGANRSFKRK
jgi:hypothetical protein